MNHMFLFLGAHWPTAAKQEWMVDNDGGTRSWSQCDANGVIKGQQPSLFMLMCAEFQTVCSQHKSERGSCSLCGHVVPTHLSRLAQANA